MLSNYRERWFTEHDLSDFIVCSISLSKSTKINYVLSPLYGEGGTHQAQALISPSRDRSPGCYHPDPSYNQPFAWRRPRLLTPSTFIVPALICPHCNQAIDLTSPSRGRSPGCYRPRPHPSYYQPFAWHRPRLLTPRDFSGPDTSKRKRAQRWGAQR